MNPRKLNAILQRLAEEAIPGGEIDLWPAIQTSLETGKLSSRQGDLSMKPRFARTPQFRLAALAVFSLLALALLAVTTPAGRAWAQSVLHYFTRTGDTVTIPTQEPASLVEIAPAPAVPESSPTFIPNPSLSPEAWLPFHETCGSLPYPRCSVEQAAALVDFPVQGLADLPAGFSFTGASGGPDRIILMYQGEGGALYLAQNPAEKDALQNWEIAGNTVVEAVMVGDQPGEYIQGGWSGLGISQPGLLAWENDAARQTLRWQQGQMRFTLLFYASKTGSGPLFDKTGLAALASSLTSQPSDTQVAIQAPYLSLQQVEQMAGFTPVEPGWLPAGYTLAGASYAADRNAICLHYRYRQQALAPDLTIFQSYGWLPSVEDIKIKQTFNGQPLDIPVTIASWPIAGVENGYATWAANGVNLAPLCGGLQMTTNKALLWRANNMNFILGAVVDQFQGRGFLTNQEMQRVAESLSGLTAAPSDAPDLERLASPSALKSLAAFEVKIPTRMLAGFYFDHAALFPAGEQVNSFAQVNETDRAVLIYLGSPLGDGSDGRYASIAIFQDASSQDDPTLAERALAGDYQAVMVNQQPALFQLSCWNDSLSGAATCQADLIWYEDGVWFEIVAWLDKALPKELLIAIAEGLR
jgi:hypothetical protein